MELNEALELIEKQLDSCNKENGFKKVTSNENSLEYESEKGLYRLVYDKEAQIISFDCKNDSGDFKTVSKSLFDIEAVTDRDCKSLANEIADEVTSLFAKAKKVDLEKIKMPKSVSRTKAKNGIISYDTDSLANRFGQLYPELKDEIRLNIATYGEFLSETFFKDIVAPKVIEIIKSKDENELKKLFKMLNEIYDDGINEVQDIIGVTILGEMRNDKEMLATADEYMSDYMSGPVHEINKITGKNSRLWKKLQSPPPYKPKKKKNSVYQSMMNMQQPPAQK